MVYKLDGSESTNQVMGRGGAQSVKSTAKWDGSSLVIETTREFQGTPITTREVRRLDNGGKEMVIESTTQTPNGEIKRKTVYYEVLVSTRKPKARNEIARFVFSCFRGYLTQSARVVVGLPHFSNQSIPSLTRSNFNA
jgi:hypothetical protein